MKYDVKKQNAAKDVRLNAKGQEILDPKPMVAYMQIDPKTGEVLAEGEVRPPTIEETLRRAVNRNMNVPPSYLYDGFDVDEQGNILDDGDGEFDTPELDGSLPILSPHQAGFVDSLAPSVAATERLARKRGLLKDPDPSPDSPQADGMPGTAAFVRDSDPAPKPTKKALKTAPIGSDDE